MGAGRGVPAAQTGLVSSFTSLSPCVFMSLKRIIMLGPEWTSVCEGAVGTNSADELHRVLMSGIGSAVCGVFSERDT